MLKFSKKPEIIRLHSLEQNERDRFISEFVNIGYEWFPFNFHPHMPLLADIYYTYMTICKSRRRLGEEYTYVAMFQQKQYEEEGVLMNQKYRTIMFVLQICQRHVITNILKRIFEKLQKKVNEGGRWEICREIVIDGVSGLLAQGRWFMMMLFMLGWREQLNLVDTILKTRYVYTFRNANQTQISYKVEGYLLLVVFVVKAMRFALKVIVKLQGQSGDNASSKKSKPKLEEKEGEEEEEEEGELCRICYSNIKSKSSTCCGHVFCWGCIIRQLENHPECPVCRTKCLPRQVVQLQNY